MEQNTEKKTESTATTTSKIVPTNIPDDAIGSLKKDSARAMTGKQGAFIKVAIAEEKKREEEKQKQIKEKKQRVLYGAIGVTLLCCSMLALIFILYPEQNPFRTPEPTVALKFGTIYAEINTTNLSRRELIQDLREEISKPIQEGLVKTIYLTKTTPTGIFRITVQEFLEKLQTNHPSALTSGIFSGEFLINVYGGRPNELFIMIRTTSNTNTLKELAVWEPTLTSDMADLFGITANIEENRTIFGTPFQDAFAQNLLTRSVKNSTDTTLLTYTLLNDRTLIIAGDENIIPSITGWLYAPKIRN